MAPHQPDGIDWRADGRIAPDLVEADANRPLSLYVHVPFCRVRCGYCDFNTYTVGFGPGAEPSSYAQSVLREADLALGIIGRRQARTVFFGGGTPTMLESVELARILGGLRDRFSFAPGAEVTVEANPETVTARSLVRLAEAGFTRVSFGMQSAVPHILATLDRTHRPERVPQVVEWARRAGLAVSVDLIYGAPGESLSDWEKSLLSAISMEPDHISAYSLIVEEGTKLASQIDRGQIEAPDEDLSATKYELADRLLGDAGYRWYEISNYARALPEEGGVAAADLRFASRHNLAYWRDWDWWGFGPGAHSHIGRTRWWNVKHPLAYAGRVAAGNSPGLRGEILTEETRALERLMLGIRTSEGVPAAEYAGRFESLLDRGLLDEAQLSDGRLVPTLSGRLLADYITRVLAGWE